MSVVGTSHHFGAMRNLVAIGAKRTSTKPRQSSSVYEYALIGCEPTISMTKRITPTDMAVGRLLGCEPQRSPRSIPRTHCIALCCGSKADWR